MNNPRNRKRLIFVSALLLLTLLVAGSALAQDGTTPTPPPSPACVADAQTACVKIVFYPATLKADLFLVDPTTGETPTSQVQQSALYVTFPNPAAGQTIALDVKNIHDGGAGEGMLYLYPDMPKTVHVPFAAGQTSTVTLYPVKKYVKGLIQTKCSPLSVAAGEDVGCTITIDGALQTIPTQPPAPNPDGTIPDVPQTIPTPPPTPAPDGTVPVVTPTTVVAPGQTVKFIIAPGKHEIKFDLVGANAALWAPASLTKTVTVSAGSSPQIAAGTFAKAGHIVATLALAADGWVGDFYLDGTQVGTQVGSIDQWVKAASHSVVVRNIAKTGSPLIHPYQDASNNFVFASSGATTNVTLAMTKIPDSSIYTPLKPDGSPNTLTTNTYVAWWPAWSAQTAELAERSADHVVLTVTLDGVYIGDVRPYRRPAELRTENGGWCLELSWKPCYSITWAIPLGRLTAGAHALHAESAPFDTQVTIGWETYNPGDYFTWDRSFTVIPATP